MSEAERGEYPERGESWGEWLVREGKSRWKCDFRDRTKRYASQIVGLYCGLPKAREEVRVLGRQMLRSGTSVAAQYREASRARSIAEFISKIESCAQEADETYLWLELLQEDCGIKEPGMDALLRETDELIAIFVTMARNAKKKL